MAAITKQAQNPGTHMYIYFPQYNGHTTALYIFSILLNIIFKLKGENIIKGKRKSDSI